MWKTLTLHSFPRLSLCTCATLERVLDMSMFVSWPLKSISTMSHCTPRPSADELAVLDPPSGPPKHFSPRFDGASGPAMCVAETLLLALAMLVFVRNTSVSIPRVSHATLSTLLTIFAMLVVDLTSPMFEFGFTRPPTPISQKGPKMRKTKRQMPLPIAAVLLSFCNRLLLRACVFRV